MAEESRHPGYIIGVMMMDVEGKNSERFRQNVTQGVKAFETTLRHVLEVRVELLAFEGPHLTPVAGAYAPLDFLQIGMTEKLERDLQFLLVVTEVDLTSTTLAYILALPSQLTNVGIISTKRLGPTFWGKDENHELTIGRLTSLLLHTFGHLLNLSHSDNPQNVMYDFTGVGDLDQMVELTDAQNERMRQTLPYEAHERTSRTARGRFILHTLRRDWKSIARAIIRANPFRLLTHLPTMITAALSVILVIFFSSEMWDVASTVELYQLVLFSVVAISVATVVLYSVFAFRGVLGRGKVLAESTVVTTVATVLSLLLTTFLLFAIFMGLTYLGIITIFPRRLMESWPTVDPAVRTLDHLKLSLLVAALGVLAGSLGGRADSRDLVRTILFIDEET